MGLAVNSCLWDLVCFRGACETADNTLVYINDIPSIDNLLLRRLINDEAVNAGEVWEKVKRRGLATFYTKVTAGLSSKFVSRTIIKNIVTGEWQQPPEDLVLSANSLKGVVVDLRGSDNTVLNIASIEIYSPAVISENLFIYDLQTGELIEQIPIELIAGYNRITINKTYNQEEIFIAYDSSIIASRETEPYGRDYYKRLSSHYLWGSDCSCDCLTSGNCASVDKGQMVIKSNLNFEECGGMIVRYSLGCSLNRWICDNTGQLAPILMYHLASELFIEAIASCNINPSTFTSTEEWDAVVMYVNKEFESQLKTFIKGTHIDDKVCVKCSTKVKRAWFLP